MSQISSTGVAAKTTPSRVQLATTQTFPVACAQNPPPPTDDDETTEARRIARELHAITADHPTLLLNAEGQPPTKPPSTPPY